MVCVFVDSDRNERSDGLDIGGGRLNFQKQE
jgi:hypothetical protein